MALRAGYYGVKRRIWEALQKTTEKLVQDVNDIWSDNALTGAKNLIDVSGTVGDHSKASVTSITSKGFTLSTTESAANVASKTPLNLVNGEKYTVSVKVTALTGTGKKITIRSSSQSIVAYKDVTATGVYTFDFTYTTGDKLAVFVTGSTAAEGSITVDDVMIRPVVDPDATYTPYAMTNQQLTNEVSIDTFEDNDTGIKAVRFGHVVTVSFESASAITAEANTVFCTLPAGFRPSLSAISFCEPIAQKRICIGDTGGVFCSSSLTAATVRGCITFVTSTAISLTRSLDASPEERSLEVEEPVVVKKSTRKKTTKTEEEE